MKQQKERQQNSLLQSLGAMTEEKTSGLAFSVATILPYILVLLFSVFASVFGLFYEGVETENWYLYVSYLLPQTSFALVAVAYCSITKSGVKSIVGKPKWSDFALAIGLQFGLLSLGFVNEWFIRWLNSFGLSVAEPTIPSLDGFGLIGVLFVVAVLPAIFEEVLFRGILMKGLKCFSWWGAVLIGGGMFSLFHQNPAQTVYQFFCGAGFALIALRSGSILPTVVSHFLNNAFIILSVKFGWNVYTLPVMILSAVCLVFTVSYLIAGLAKQKEQRKTALDKKQFFLCASVGIAVCVLGWVTGLLG